MSSSRKTPPAAPPAPTIRPAQNHDVKIWPGDFEAVVDGRKTADIRRSDDRKYRVGDLLTFREWAPAPTQGGPPAPDAGQYTGRLQRARVTHVDRMAGPRMLLAMLPQASNDVVACVVLSFGKIST